MALMVSGKDLEVGGALIGLAAGQLKTEFVYGNEVNMMVATRTGGYHSKPHRHAPEQMNYVIEGNLWVFVENSPNSVDAYYLEKGDYLRIPGGWLHWAWNPNKSNCVLIEAHAPVLDPSARHGATGLFDDRETPRSNKYDTSETVDIDVREIERKALAKRGYKAK